MKRTFEVFIIFPVLICIALCGCAEKNKYLRESGIALPLKDSMVIDFSVKSNYMRREMPCRIYLPKGYGGGRDYPVWYGLNSYGTTESMWIQAGITESADELIDLGTISPLIMVFPYTRDATAQELKKDFEDDGKFDERNIDRFICEELIPYIDSCYDTARSADKRYIGGFSMGGAIALRLALRHTDIFSKVGGYSPAVTFRDYSGRQLEQWLFPNDNPDMIDDITKFDRKKKLDKLAVYLDAGNSNDPFSVGVQSLYDALQKRRIKSEFHLYNGGHSLDHNKRNFQNYLQFYVAGNRN